MPKSVSAGLMMFARDPLRVLLVHPGGPYFRKRDHGWWSVPKGLPEPDEALVDAAVREFREEIGLTVAGQLLELGQVKQKGGKVVHCWAFEGELPPDFELASNTFEIEWPPRSGRRATFPEVDRAEMFELPEARGRINTAQAAFLDRLEARLGG